MSGHRTAPPVTRSLVLSVLFGSLLVLPFGGCGEQAAPAWWSDFHDLSHVPLSSDLRPGLEAAVARLGTPAPDTPSVRDFNLYRRWHEELAHPAARTALGDSLYARWAADPGNVLWLELAHMYRHRLDRGDDFAAMLARPALSDTTRPLGLVATAMVTSNTRVTRGMYRRALERSDELAPLSRVRARLNYLYQTRTRDNFAASIFAAIELAGQAREIGGPSCESLVWDHVAAGLIKADRLDDALWAAAMCGATAAEAGHAYQVLEARLTIAQTLGDRGEKEAAVARLGRYGAQAEAKEYYWLAIRGYDRAAQFASVDGDYETALHFDRIRLPLVRRIGDVRNIPRTLACIADDHRLAGRLDSTRVYLDKAAAEVRAHPDITENAAKMAELLAEYACEVGRYAEAESLLAAAAEANDRWEGPSARARLMLQMVPSALDAGRPDLAYAWLAEIRRLENVLPARYRLSNQIADLEILSARLLAQQGETREAAAALDRARAALDRVDNAETRWNLEARSGQLAIQRGDAVAAERHFLSCLDAALQGRNARTLARSRFQMGEFYLAEGRYADARAMFSLLSSEITFGHAYRTGLTSLLMLGLTSEAEGDLAAAEHHLEAGLARLGADAPRDLVVRFRLALARVHSRQGRCDAARSELSGLIERHDVELDHFADLELFREGISRDVVRAAVANEVRAAGTPAAAAAASLAWAHPELALQHEAGTLPLPALVFLVGDDQSWAWRIADDGIELRRLPAAPELRELAAPLLVDLGEPDRPLDAARRDTLAATLLGDLATVWPAGGTLHLLPDGVLRLVPWTALNLPGTDQLLLDRGPLLEWPAAGPNPHEHPAAPSSLDLLAVGCDEPAAEVRRLRQAEREAAEIGAAWNGPRALVLQGAAATWPGVVAAGLDTFGVIHIASHAEIHHGTGRRSTLRLVTGEGSRPVTMTEVARLGLEAELVFLSSCRSGQPLSAPVAGPDDFTEAFLAAGAHAVIASTSWADDTAARRLADSFYRHWRAGASRAAALQQARKDVQRDHPHPSYWAFTRLVARSD